MILSIALLAQIGFAPPVSAVTITTRPYVWAYGDSKSNPTGYPPVLERMLSSKHNAGVVVANGYYAGATVALRVASLAADITAMSTVPNMKVILINLGANDVGALPAEATWEADLATILDAMHAAWPTAKVYVMRPWRRGYATECNSLAAWIGVVLATRSAWAFVGPDERIFLENGDDGTTYTSDGVHPTYMVGMTLTAYQYAVLLGTWAP